MPVRELRSLVPVEVLAVLVLAVVPLPDAVPIALPLLAAASLSRWARGRSWGELFASRDAAFGAASQLGIGAAAGLAALVGAVLAGAPLVEALSQRAVEWSLFPLVRGNASFFAMIGAYVVATAIATELALRGWLVERVLELSPGPPVLPILVGALAEAALTPGDVAARAGAACFGLGLGWIYVASGRRLWAPVAARLVFQLGALGLEATRALG